jgi:hypothetical protein
MDTTDDYDPWLMQDYEREAEMWDEDTCGLRGDSDVGYCACTEPKGHPAGAHACQHGYW